MATINTINQLRPSAAAGDNVSNAQTAKDDGAGVVNPPGGQEVLTPDGRIQSRSSISASNADLPKTEDNGDVDAGTNAPTRPLQNTQSIPANSTPGIAQTPVKNPSLTDTSTANASTASAGRKIGVGAATDDQPTGNPIGTANVVRNRIDELYGDRNGAIKSQDNILDQFYNYTYGLSWYILTPETYNALIQGGKRNLNGMYLLAQSGGAPVGQQTTNAGINPTGVSSTTIYGRSPFFNLDYYIDNLELDIAYSSSISSGGASSVKKIKFTLTEPNGITLLRNLYNACNDVMNTSPLGSGNNSHSYSTLMYCMIIRFYGYDENGNLVQPISKNIPNTDRTAAVEKFIPFIITNINFTVANKLVEYTIEGSGPDTSTGQSSIRGVVPQDFQFFGSSVKDILVGANQQQTPSQAVGDETRNGVPVSSLPSQYSTADDQSNTNIVG